MKDMKIVGKTSLIKNFILRNKIVDDVSKKTEREIKKEESDLNLFGGQFSEFSVHSNSQFGQIDTKEDDK